MHDLQEVDIELGGVSKSQSKPKMTSKIVSQDIWTQHKGDTVSVALQLTVPQAERNYFEHDFLPGIYEKVS